MATLTSMHGPTLPTGSVPIDTGTAELVRHVDDPASVTLFVNGAESSHLDLSDPTRLEFEYMQQMVAVIDRTHPAPAPLHVTHLGAGGCALARAIDALRPGSRQLAVDIDATLVAHARDWFALPRAPRLRLRADDARAAAARLRRASQHVVVRDVFAGQTVPEHVRTVEFTRLVADCLQDDGVYLANCADSPPLLQARREVATVAQVFGEVALIAEPGVLKGRRRGNLVVVGARTPLPQAALARALRCLPQPVTLVAGDSLADFARTARPWVDAVPVAARSRPAPLGAGADAEGARTSRRASPFEHE